MAFFKFGRKIEASKEYSLEDIPLFSSLAPAEQKIIEKRVRLVEYKRGDLVYEEGTPSEAFYVVVSGRFRVFNNNRSISGGETLFYLYRGDHFGETSLLTGQNHSASIEAKRDGLVLRLQKKDFLKLVEEIPSISLHLNRSLGHRLTKSENPLGRRREVKVAALYAHSDVEDSAMFWMDLAAKVVRETQHRAIIVDFSAQLLPAMKEELKKSALPFLNLDDEYSSDSDVKQAMVEHLAGFWFLHVPVTPSQDPKEKRIAALITHLTYRFDYLLLRLPPELDHLNYHVLKRSDMVYVYCSPEASKLSSCSTVISDFQTSFGFGKNEIKVIVPQKSDDHDLSFEEKERLLNLRIFSLLPSKLEKSDRYHAMVRFLSRELAGTLVGLALGSGAAYGLSHIGIFRVFERENIPIDVISGASIGALVGAFWAAGHNADELEKIAKSVNRRNAFFKLVGFQDLSMAHRGFIKGNQIVRFLESYFGNMTFQDLRVPVKIVAANLFNSEEVVFEAGRVVDAIRASISIPGIFRPYVHRGDPLIDGGVIDPLPVRVLSQMGVKKIIAVNVLCSAKDRRENAKAKERAKYHQLRSIADKDPISQGVASSIYRLNRHYSTNIFNVIMNTIQFMEYELAEISGNEADILIHPEVAEGHWAQFYEPDKFIKAGEQKALEHLAEIKQLIAE